MRSAGRRVLTNAARSYLRGRTRVINMDAFRGGSIRRAAVYRQRAMRTRPRRQMRRYKMYRRSVPSSGLRTRQITTDTTGAATNKAPTAGIAVSVNQYTENNLNCQMGAIYVKPLPAPSPISSVTNQRSRHTNHVNYHGYKINRTFALPYLEIRLAGSVQVNWALIQFRRNGYENCFNAGGVKESLYDAFFRHAPRGSAVNDDEDFDDYTSASQTWSHEMNVCAMNPDNNYKIITHRRFILTDKNGTEGVGNGGPGKQRVQWAQCWMKNINFYYKLGKAFSFTDNSSPNPETPICEIWWYNTITDNDKPADVTLTSTYALNTFNKNTLYFSDTT